MSERGAEGIRRRRREEAARQQTPPASSPASARPRVQHDVERTPSRRQNAAKGAAGGAVAGPEGAALGAVLGALSGGKKRRVKGPGRKALTGEFLACMAVVLVRPLGDPGAAPGPWMRKAAAVMATYAVLGFMSAIGETPRRVANGLGLLVLLAVVVADDAVLTRLLGFINGATAAPSQAQLTASVGGRTPAQVVGDIINGDPTLTGPGFAPGTILTQGGIPGSPITVQSGPPTVGIPGLPAGIGGNG